MLTGSSLWAKVNGNFVLQFGACRTPELQYHYLPFSPATVRHAPFNVTVSESPRIGKEREKINHGSGDKDA